MYRALEAQRIATVDSPVPLPAASVGGFPRAEFLTADMPVLQPSALCDGGLTGMEDAAEIGAREGFLGGSVVTAAGPPRAVNVLAMERLGDNLMTLSQVRA